ncbi:hypothetical protein PF005_g23990 [Phytophthora fragariae]|uniref:Uncharacterized protein n=1 Tax=Phytophthora fragariae TaxID=53985 RepID=A0A6A3W4K2_9STRA|nr:hypothetical protein PF003_g6119 [Phytophthora fragariae]KAE8947526.1 hypothetical protein PF009_g2862 [Phytophthora fragariae]KAE9130069.1 hypothetical protein PF007_g4667 [Phytophthora fragariae]KAE9150880.1 hypothetical protein PF006_g4778 [Phytophthora fragariae]KAE9178657.1 hypothetical protein PF005_g23990 [Phytophthora fragariae]
MESALEPNPDHEESSGRNTPESAAGMPVEAFWSDDIPDRSVNAVRVLFQRPSCGPDPNRTVIYESFGMKTGWGPARAAESNPALVTPTKPPELPPPVVEEPQTEGVDGPELVPKRVDPDDTKTATPHARVFTFGELNALENGELSAVADEKEEYEKELEERLFPLDEIELQRRMKKNAEQQKELSLSELSAILDIPEEKLTRTRDSSLECCHHPNTGFGGIRRRSPHLKRLSVPIETSDRPRRTKAKHLRSPLCMMRPSLNASQGYAVSRRGVIALTPVNRPL